MCVSTHAGFIAMVMNPLSVMLTRNVDVLHKHLVQFPTLHKSNALWELVRVKFTTGHHFWRVAHQQGG